MQVLGSQVLAHLGEWIRAHWGEEVQLLSSDEEREGNINPMAREQPGTEAAETQQGEKPELAWGNAMAKLPDADSGAASSTTLRRPLHDQPDQDLRGKVRGLAPQSSEDDAGHLQAQAPSTMTIKTGLSAAVCPVSCCQGGASGTVPLP